MKHWFRRVIALAIFTVLLQSISARAQNTVISYQGRVTDVGTNFTGTGQFQFALVTSTNANLTATAIASNPVSGFITTIAVTFGGNGYVTAPAVTISGGGGTNVAATAVLSNGVVIAININAGGNGSGYSSAPTVTVAPPPAALTYTTYWSNDGTSSAGSEPTAAVSVGVTNGLFAVNLGDPTIAGMTTISAALFDQPGLQLRIWFSDGVQGFAGLSPVQNLNPVPYADYAGTASNLLGTVAATQLTGTLASNSLPVSPQFSGTVTAVFFAGNGTNLTSLNASSLTGGTVPLAQLSGITSNQLDATTWRMATNLNGGNAALATNVVLGIAITNAAISGSTFAGNGGGLTNLNASQLVSIGNTNGSAAGNFFAGAAGNPSMSGYNNTAIGVHALQANTNGLNNTASGLNALLSNTAGSSDTADGAYALQANTNGSANAAVGYYALYANVTGGFDTALGANALDTNTNGTYNTAIGASALLANAGGNNNTAVGYNALSANVSGSNNIAVGYQAGSVATLGNSNIDIGNPGLSTDVNIVRIGSGQSATYLPGTVYANNVALTSDRNAKENFAPVNTQEVLARVSALAIDEWQYKFETQSIRHLGPMAQDFHAAFGLNGSDDRHISAVDENGVALAAIQGLDQKLDARSRALEAENAQLKAENDQLEKRLERLEAMMPSIDHK